jgi:hypothetical protein
MMMSLWQGIGAVPLSKKKSYKGKEEFYKDELRRMLQAFTIPDLFMRATDFPMKDSFIDFIEGNQGILKLFNLEFTFGTRSYKSNPQSHWQWATLLKMDADQVYRDESQRKWKWKS